MFYNFMNNKEKKVNEAIYRRSLFSCGFEAPVCPAASNRLSYQSLVSLPEALMSILCRCPCFFLVEVPVCLAEALVSLVESLVSLADVAFFLPRPLCFCGGPCFSCRGPFASCRGPCFSLPMSLFFLAKVPVSLVKVILSCRGPSVVTL